MPGGAHDVRAKNSAIGKRLLNVVVRHAWQAQAKRPFCRREILGLDSTEPLHESLRCFKRWLGDVLVVKPPVRKVQIDHGSFVSCSVGYRVMILWESSLAIIALKEGKISPCLRRLMHRETKRIKYPVKQTE